VRVESYVLHLYCDSPKEEIGRPCMPQVVDGCWVAAPHFPDVIDGNSKREAYAHARAAGWRLGKKDYCPYCVRVKEGREGAQEED